MKKILFLSFALFLCISVNAQDFAGLLKPARVLTNAQADTVSFDISGSRSAITFKYAIVKTSGTVAGTIVLQSRLSSKTTDLAAEEWFTENSYTLTDASAVNVLKLTSNPALHYRIITTTTGTQVSSHRKYLLYRK